MTPESNQAAEWPKPMVAWSSWIKPVFGTLTIVGVLSYLGYASRAMRLTILGVPHLWVPVEQSVKDGVSVIVSTIMALPVIVEYCLDTPWAMTKAVLPILIVYGLFRWFLAKNPRFRPGLVECNWEKLAKWRHLAAGLILVAVAMLLAHSLAPMFEIGSLLGGSLSPATPTAEYLRQLIQASSGSLLTLRYLSFVVSLAVVWHMCVLFEEAPAIMGPVDCVRKVNILLRWISILALVIASLGVPAVYSLPAAVAPVPTVVIVLDTDPPQTVGEGVLLTHGSDWFAIYDPHVSAVRMVPSGAIASITAGPRVSPFCLSHGTYQ